jgi:hypothetical protein
MDKNQSFYIVEPYFDEYLAQRFLILLLLIICLAKCIVVLDGSIFFKISIL